MRHQNTPTKTEVRTLTPLTLLVLSVTPVVTYLDGEPGVRAPVPAPSTQPASHPRLPATTSGAVRS